MRRLFGLVALLLVASSPAQLRVATYNISNYGGGRSAAVQTAFFAAYQGRSLNPDVIVCQEFTSASANAAFVSILNTAPGSSGTWAAAPFTDGPDTDSACFYRTDRLSFLGATIISHGGSAPEPPRDTKRYDFQLLGYTDVTPKFAIYSVHLKAGTASSDLSRRLTETTRIRDDAEALDSSYWGFAIGGDYNIQSSTETAYTQLIGSQTNNAGRVFDPISTPGTWDGASAFKYVHTQDPSNFGMDSRYDFMLLSGSLVDGQGMDYLGHYGTPYSTTTWNDLNHSYRVWGNDGTSFGNNLTVANNQMVGPAIAQALIDAATTAGGHLPVFLDMLAPAEVGTDRSILDLGTVVQGSNPTGTLTVSNSASSTLWRTGIASLLYSLSATGGFTAPAGQFSDAGGGGGNAHSIGLDTSAVGPKSGMLTVSSPTARVNAKTVQLVANVVSNLLDPDSITVTAGKRVDGTLASVLASDDLRYEVSPSMTVPRGSPNSEVELTATCPVTSLNSLTLTTECRTAFTQMNIMVKGWDTTTGTWQVISESGPLTSADALYSSSFSSPTRFVDPSTHTIRMRVGFRVTASSVPRLMIVGLDQLKLTIG